MGVNERKEDVKKLLITVGGQKQLRRERPAPGLL